MTWWGWLLLGIYILGWMIAVPRIGYVFASDLGGYKSTLGGDDVAAGLFFGSMIGLAWPLVFPIHAWYRYAKSHHISGSGLLIPPRYIRQETEMRQRELAVMERERRIREMERELGVGQ